MTMGAVGLVVFVLGYALVDQFVIPPTVSDFDAQVVEPLLIVLVIAGFVSFASGVAFCVGGGWLGTRLTRISATWNLTAHPDRTDRLGAISQHRGNLIGT